jgi:hypothetical protein
MAKAQPQSIGPHTFDTKGAAEAFIQEVLYRHPLLEPITGDDHAFVLDLLKKHKRAAEKIGAGVKHFTVENAKGGTRCFYITRVDGISNTNSVGLWFRTGERVNRARNCRAGPSLRCKCRRYQEGSYHSHECHKGHVVRWIESIKMGYLRNKWGVIPPNRA